MKKSIIIIVDVEVPVKHLLNNNDYEIYEAIGNESIFTMVKKDFLASNPLIITTKNPIVTYT